MSAPPEKRSLASLLPGRWYVPALLAIAVASLGVAYALPVMVVSKFWFFSDDVTLMGSIAGMWDEGYYGLGILIFAFSVVFPLAKLLAVAGVWFLPFTARARRRLLGSLTALGRWSMLDVFVVAVVVVLTQSKAVLGAEPREGLYVFGAAILLSMGLTVWVERLAERAVDTGRGGVAGRADRGGHGDS